MRKIYLTMVLAMTIAYASAQITTIGPSVNFSDAKTTAMKKAVMTKRAADKTISSRWYDYASTMDVNAAGGQSKLGFTYLFPDTLAKVSYGTTNDDPWVHAIAIVIDPKSDWFGEDGNYGGEQYIDASTPYTVDSVEIYCSYSRNTTAAIVDTLRFEVMTTDDANGMGIEGFLNMSNYGVDTLLFRSFKRTGLVSNSTTMQVIDVLLNEADTATVSNGWNIYSIAPNAAVPAGEMLAVTVKFIPGYTYEDTTLITSTRNYFIFASMEEMGEDTYPTYAKRDWNTSQIIPYFATNAGNNWEDLYIPEWAFAKSYRYENHLINYKITADAGFVGVENATNNGLSVNQNRPNPFTGMTTVSYSLDKAANVDVTIYNVTGAKVMTINEGVQTAGSHQVQINASDLQAGVYYYTFTADGYTVTKKMIIY
jgi:hypothetical protein